MIPKVIHYCWLGGKPLPPLAEKCLDSWQKYCPDYKIIRWDESNYDFTKHPYMREALEAKKWGFVPDYARLDIVYQYGGIYLDTDVEIVKSFDSLLEHSCFIGFESERFVNLGNGFGAEIGHPILKMMMEDYDNYHFRNSNGTLNLLPSPLIQTKLLKKYDLKEDNGEIQNLDGNIVIYPQKYFCPKNKQKRPQALPDSFSVHHYMGSWVPWHWKLFCFLHRMSDRILGKKITAVGVKIRHILFK